MLPLPPVRKPPTVRDDFVPVDAYILPECVRIEGETLWPKTWLIAMQPGVAKPTASDLERHVRGSLSASHAPVGFRVVDTLPRTPSLEIDLKAVRALLDQP